MQRSCDARASGDGADGPPAGLPWRHAQTCRSCPACPTSPAIDFGRRLSPRPWTTRSPTSPPGLAYRFLFALFPFAIFLAALAALVAQAGSASATRAAQIMGAVGDNLPPDIAAAAQPQLQAVLGDTRPGLLTIGALVALWAATGGIGALHEGASTRRSTSRRRGFVAKTGVAVALTLLGTLGILVAFVTIVGGSLLTEQARPDARDPGGDVGRRSRCSAGRSMLVLVALAVAVLLRFAPNVAVRSAGAGRRLRVRHRLAGRDRAVRVLRRELRELLEHVWRAGRGRRADAVVLPDRVMLLLAAELTALLAKDHAPERIAARQRETKGRRGRRGADRSRRLEPARPRSRLPHGQSRSWRRPAPAASRRRRRCWRSSSCCAGVIAGALAGLVTRDGPKGALTAAPTAGPGFG